MRNQARLIWYGIKKRCFAETRKQRDLSYAVAGISEEWMDFENFYEWFADNYIEGCDIDKDWLVPGNKVYGPTTCCFCPPEINAILISREARRGIYPIGVDFHQNKYRGRYRRMDGSRPEKSFKTAEEAHQWYKDNKQRYIRETALEYFKAGKIKEELFKAMMRYKIQ